MDAELPRGLPPILCATTLPARGHNLHLEASNPTHVFKVTLCHCFLESWGGVSVVLLAAELCQGVIDF